MNRLIWEDNILAMQALLASGYEGKIGLIYIDPPFWTNEDYYAKFEVWDKEITKLPSIILFTSSFSMAPSLGITINILIHFYW